MASIDEITTTRCRSPRASTVIYHLDRRSQAPSRLSHLPHRHHDSEIPGTPMTRRVDNILMSLAPSPFLQSTGYIPQPGPSRSPVSLRGGKQSFASPSTRTVSSAELPSKRKTSLSIKKDSYWPRRSSIDSTTTTEVHLLKDETAKQPIPTEKRKGLGKLRFRKAKPKTPPIAEAPHSVGDALQQRHHARDRSLPPTPSNESPAASILSDVTPPASPAKRRQAGDMTKFARQMGIPNERPPRTPAINTEGLQPPPSSSPPWRNSGISDRSVSPMLFSPPTPVQKTILTPADSPHHEHPLPAFPSSKPQSSTPERATPFIPEPPAPGSGSSTSYSHCELGDEESDTESATLQTISDGHHLMLHRGGHSEANASLPSLATASTNESEIHFIRPHTPFSDYMLADEKQVGGLGVGGQHTADASLRWLHDFGHEEEGIIVIVREPVKEKWSGEWNFELHEVISAIRFL